MRVTDLEKFALDHIWRPYWPTYRNSPVGEPIPSLDRLPFTLDETVAQLTLPSEWRTRVINRITRIGVTFPTWVQHPLVDTLKALIADHAALRITHSNSGETR